MERYRRMGKGAWEYTEATSGVIELVTGARLDLDHLYADLPS